MGLVTDRPPERRRVVLLRSPPRRRSVVSLRLLAEATRACVVSRMTHKSAIQSPPTPFAPPNTHLVFVENHLADGLQSLSQTRLVRVLQLKQRLQLGKLLFVLLPQ